MFEVGVVIGITPLTVAIFAPVVGYLVSNVVV